MISSLVQKTVNSTLLIRLGWVRSFDRVGSFLSKPTPKNMIWFLHRTAFWNGCFYFCRLNTDIALGYYGGFRSLMVLTGFSTLEEAQSYKTSSVESERAQVPHYYVPALGDIGQFLDELEK